MEVYGAQELIEILERNDGQEWEGALKVNAAQELEGVLGGNDALK